MTSSGAAAQQEDTDREAEEPVEKFRQKLTRSGSGGGVSLRFTADFATQYGLDADTEVDVEVVETEGDIEFRIGNIPAGFTLDDLEEFAADHGWEPTDRYVDEDEWYLTYRNSSDHVRIEIDSEARVNGRVVNNIVVEGDPVDVTGDLAKFNRLCAAAQRKNLEVRVDDSEGLWQRLRASTERDTDDAPDEETFEQLSERTEQVTAQLVCLRTSLRTSLSDLGRIVTKIEQAYDELEG